MTELEEGIEQGFWYVVVNASDPQRHDVGWCRGREYADNLAADMNRDHGYRYEVEEHTGDAHCSTCYRERSGVYGTPLPEILCYGGDAVYLGEHERTDVRP